MNRLIENGDIILNGGKTREQLTQEAFKKLEDIEDLLECWEIGSLLELSRVLYHYNHLCNIKEDTKKSQKALDEIMNRRKHNESKTTSD